jgi:C4-dicarboxylate-binding protein DctP
VVDGTENPPSNLYTQKMHEVQKFVTLSDHGYLGYAVIVNKKFWDALPSDVRQQLDAAMEQATRYANQIAKIENDTALEAVKKSGKSELITLTPDQKKAWKKPLIKVHDQMADRIGKDLIQSIYKETGLDPAKL